MSNTCEHCKYWLRVSDDDGLCSANRIRDYEDRIRLMHMKPAQSCGKFTRVNPDTCNTCAYYDTDGHSGHGRCRRNSPRPLSQSPESRNTTPWPDVCDADWCGEHKSKL